jgi:hypothetical protein
VAHHYVCLASSYENSEHLQSQIRKKTLNSRLVHYKSPHSEARAALSKLATVSIRVAYVMVKPEPDIHVDLGPEDSRGVQSTLRPEKLASRSDFVLFLARRPLEKTDLRMEILFLI